MKKAEYIEKYGEEAYKKLAEERKDYYRKNRERILNQSNDYYKNNKEKVKVKLKEYRENNRDKILEQQRKWCEKNRDKLKIYDYNRKKKYREENRDKYLEQQRKWRENNRDKTRKSQKQYYDNNKEKARQYKKTKMGRADRLLCGYNRSDRNRGLDISNNVNSKWIVNNIFSGQKCVYCGDSDWTHLGCDRIDNNKPHTPENCVPCCFVCNTDRADKFTVEEFKFYRALHPRACDMPKSPAIQIGATGALKKRIV